MAQERGVVLLWCSGRQPLGIGKTREVTGNPRQRSIMDIHRVSELAQVGDHPARVRQRCAVGEWTASDVQDIDSELGSRHVRQRGKADGAMGMQFQRLGTNAGTDGRNQRACALGSQEAGRVLDVQARDIGRSSEHAGEIGVKGVIVYGADRVGEPGEHLATLLANHPRAIEQRLAVVHGIDQCKSRDAVFHQRAIGESHELRVGGLPRDETKAGGDELQRRMGRCGAHAPDQHPGVLLVRAHAHAHVSARGEVDRVQPDPVHDRRNLQGLGNVQPGGAPDALVAVPDRDIDELDIRHCQR